MLGGGGGGGGGGERMGDIRLGVLGQSPHGMVRYI